MVVKCSVLEDLKYSGNGCDEEYNNQMVKKINSVLYIYLTTTCHHEIKIWQIHLLNILKYIPRLLVFSIILTNYTKGSWYVIRNKRRA